MSLLLFRAPGCSGDPGVNEPSGSGSWGQLWRDELVSLGDGNWPSPYSSPGILLWMLQITSKCVKTLWVIFLPILHTNSEDDLGSNLHWLTGSSWQSSHCSLLSGTSADPEVHQAEQALLAPGVLGQTPAFCPTTPTPARYKSEQMSDPENLC